MSDLRDRLRHSDLKERLRHSDLRERLRHSDLRERLRRYGGVVPAPAAPESPSHDGAGASADDLRASLRARAARAGSRSAAGRSAGAAAEPMLKHAPPEGLREEAGPEGPVLVRTERFPPTDAFARALAADVAQVALFARDARLLALDPRSALFLDTETTSLSGGAGVLVFLVGLGRFDADGSFVLRQHFLASPARERATLAAVGRELASARSVVTFFGKSFDRHRLEDKFRIHGLDSGFPVDLHADLYHVTRARFGWKLADGKLRTVERSLLGIERPDDLPGSEAPAAYFDWLAGRPSPLPRVFEHNRDDVLSLVTLLERCARPLEDGDPREALAGAKAARALRDWARVRALSLRARGVEGTAERREALRGLADAARRLEGKEAEQPWLVALAESGCPKAALDLARDAVLQGETAERVVARLDRAESLSADWPAGRARDELRARIGVLRRRVAQRC